MRKVVIAIFVILGILVVIGLLAAAGIGMVAAFSKPSVPSRTVIEIDFEAGIAPFVPNDPIGQLLNEQATTVKDVVDGLDRAATDDKVRGVVARIGAGGLGVAHIQEVRDAVLRFRQSGKPAVVFAETFGEFGPGNGGYYLASAFDEIYLQPSGDIGLNGIAYESMFMRGAFDKLEVKPQMDQRYEYKNAMNQYTHTEMTDAHRYAMQELMESQFDQMVRGIAEERGQEPDVLRAKIDEGPFLGQEAVDAGLVDGLAYRDEVYDGLLDADGKRAKLVYIGRYLERAGRPNQRGTTIALVEGYGAVVRGASQYSPFTGQAVMGSDTVAGALRAAIADDDVEAIVFRVDSPGGSYVASDTIYHEVERAREAGKPVIISMGNLAASGGYFVAMNADKIVAQPGTITGSIGVLGGKLITRDAWGKLGVTFDGVFSAENASMFSGNVEYTESGYERFQAWLDRVYEDFTGKVAEGRNLPLEQVLEVAKGRVWTGEDAMEVGLVDALGGYEKAYELAREALELAADAPIEVRSYPLERSPWDQLFSPGPESSDQVMARTALQVLEEIQPYARMAEQIGFGRPKGVLEMPWDLSRFEAGPAPRSQRPQ